MAARRPAKIATTKKEKYTKQCPVCSADGKQNAMIIMKMVRYTKPSGMFWICQTCNNEIPTRT